jgi:hypothetical protein
MNGKRMTGAAIVVLLTATMALTQTKDIQNKTSERLVEERSAQLKSQVLREDVEILRRLLARAIAESYGLKADDPARIHGHEGLFLPWESNQSSILEGTYLKGYGIVYSVSLPVPPSEPVPVRDAGAAKPLSDWERTRKELRGEQVDDGPHGRGHKVALSGSLLRVLAENGSHLTMLEPNENVSVTVTIRNSLACAQCHAVPGGTMGGPGTGGMRPGGTDVGPGMMAPGGGMRMGPGPGMAPGMGTMPGAAGPPGFGPTGPPTSVGEGVPGLGVRGPGGPDRGSMAGSPGGPGGDRRSDELDVFAKTVREGRGSQSDPEVENNLLLGDLHLKQGRYPKAIEAYQKALELTLNLLKEGERPGQVPAARFQSLVTAMELYGKLGQANLGAGNADKAREALGKAASYARQVEKAVSKDQEPEKPKETKPTVPLPAKLTITVSGKLLQAAAANKTSPEEFRRQATVEYLK